jgi:hypothetical protein
MHHLHYLRAAFFAATKDTSRIARLICQFAVFAFIYNILIPSNYLLLPAQASAYTQLCHLFIWCFICITETVFRFTQAANSKALLYKITSGNNYFLIFLSDAIVDILIFSATSLITTIAYCIIFQQPEYLPVAIYSMPLFAVVVTASTCYASLSVRTSGVLVFTTIMLCIPLFPVAVFLHNSIFNSESFAIGTLYSILAVPFYAYKTSIIVRFSN